MGEVRAAWVAHMRARNLRESTIEARIGILSRLQRHIGRHPLYATTDELVSYLERVGPTGRSKGAAWRGIEISHLRMFYRWAQLEGLIDRDPTVRLVVPKRRRRLPRPIPSSDLAVALAGAPDPIRAMLHLAAYGGLRACEIAPLHGEDFLDDKPAMLIIQETKGGDTRSVPVGPVLLPIARALPARDWWFPRADGAGPLPRYMISRRCNAYLRGLGIPHTLHSLRHWFATETYRATEDVFLTMELMGHRDPATTALYTKVANHRGAAAVAKLPTF